jgi:uncharacterized protein YcfL
MFYYPRNRFSELLGKRCAALLCLLWLAVAGCSSSSNQNEPASFATPLSAPPPDQSSAPPPTQQPAALPPPQQPVVRPPAQPTVPTAKDNRTLFDSSISRALHAAKVQYMTGPEGYLKIQVDVENLSDASQSFRYGIEWLNGNGDVLPFANNGFLDWTLRPHETSTIAATAPTAAAKDFRVVFVGPSKK